MTMQPQYQQAEALFPADLDLPGPETYLLDPNSRGPSNRPSRSWLIRVVGGVLRFTVVNSFRTLVMMGIGGVVSWLFFPATFLAATAILPAVFDIPDLNNLHEWGSDLMDKVRDSLV